MNGHKEKHEDRWGWQTVFGTKVESFRKGFNGND